MSVLSLAYLYLMYNELLDLSICASCTPEVGFRDLERGKTT
jgi:hypothetical protein